MGSKPLCDSKGRCLALRGLEAGDSEAGNRPGPPSSQLGRAGCSCHWDQDHLSGVTLSWPAAEAGPNPILLQKGSLARRALLPTKQGRRDRHSLAGGSAMMSQRQQDE